MSLKRLTKQKLVEDKLKTTSALAESAFDIVASSFDSTIEEAIENKIAQLGSAITDVSSIIALPGKISNLEASVNAATSSISALGLQLNEIDEVSNSFAALSSNFTLLFSDLSTEVQDVKIAQGNLLSRLDVVEGAYTSLFENNLSYRNLATNLNTSFQSLNSAFSALQSNFIAQSSRLNFLDTTVTTFSNEIQNVQTNLRSELATEVQDLENKVQAEETRATAAETNLSNRATILESKFVTTVITEGTSHTAVAGETIIVNLSVPEAFAVTLPVSPSIGDRVAVKDGNGSAQLASITVTGTSAIDGKSEIVIKQKYGFALLIYNGSQWNIIGLHNSNEKFSETFLLMGAV